MKSVLDDLDRRRQTRYCIYRWTRPITPETLPLAELIAEVKPLSGWNLDGRNIGRPIDRFIATARVLNWHQWNPFQNATIDGDYGRDCPIDRFVIRDGQAPLPRGTGLYVHTAGRSERAYYAVITAIDGVENTRDIAVGVNVTGPVDEKVSDPEPVLHGLHRLRHSGHDVILFHVLDEAEVAFPFDGMVELEDPESHERRQLDADHFRRDYLAELTAFRETYRRECSQARIDYVPLDTSMQFDKALTEYLVSRQARR